MSDHWDVLKSLLPTYRAVTTAEVHDGRGTTFWLDAWNGDDDLATSFPALFSHVRSPEVSVRDVVDQGLQTMLVPRLTAEAERELAEVESLLATLTLSEEPDKRSCFATTEDDKLQAGALYHVLCGDDQGMDEATKFIWRNCAPPRVKFFGWLVQRGKIQCKVNLARKGIVQDTICEACRGGEETVPHILFHCEFAKQFGSCLGRRRRSRAATQCYT